MNIDVKHKLGNFHLTIAMQPSDEQLAKLVSAGVKKLTDGAASGFFKGVKDRRAEKPFNEGDASTLAAEIQKALGEYGTCTVTASAREWTDAGGAKALLAAQAKATYEKLVAGGTDATFASNVTGYVPPVVAAPVAAPTTATLE